MPAYQHGNFIGKAIESVLNQTWRDFELIVVDDGSTDNTGEVVQQFGTLLNYIRQENKGQAAARNHGIAEARGKYICFLDDDDLWEPGYLETVVSTLESEPETAALYTGFRLIDREDKLLPQISNRVVPPERMYNALIEGGWFPPLVVTVRRKCLDQVGPLEETLQGHDDWELWVRIARDHIFRGISDLLARYRVHDGGLSSNIDHMLNDRILAVSKHFGPPEGEASSWPEDKRLAYGAAYRSAALGRLARGNVEMAWGHLLRAVEIYPALLNRLSTLYELACGSQPLGYRGQADRLDIEHNAADLFRRLDALFASSDSSVRALRGVAYGNTYLALAMLSDQAGDWAAARRYLWAAVRRYPTLLRDWSVVRRMVKLHLGQRAVNGLRSFRPAAVGHSEG